MLCSRLVAGDGHEGIQAVFIERNRVGGNLAFLAFDVLELDRKSVMREPWEHRRKRLEDLLAGATLPALAWCP
jgi:ATP-dependent DNA ligase